VDDGWGRKGGPHGVVKNKLSTGYNLTQLMIGSEGRALATEVTVRLYPRLAHAATLLVPFPDLPP
jgi:glycolate oxidase